MALLKLFKFPSESHLAITEYPSIRAIIDHVRDCTVKIEYCYYLLHEGISFQDLDKIEKILGDSWEDLPGLAKETKLVIEDATLEFISEVGPRLGFETAWSANCVSILKSIGISTVKRVEKATRYHLKFVTQFPENYISAVKILTCDSMTQQVNEEPLSLRSFLEYPRMEQWSEVNVMDGDLEAFTKKNEELGLCFDGSETLYYYEVFKNRLKRNPTTVELFDLAQSNSEHSRHWLFKGEYVLDGLKLPRSLMDMVMSTNSAESTNQNNVIKFSDNSSGIFGWEVPIMTPKDPKKSSTFSLNEGYRHIIFTAETHNFPTGVEPFNGAATGVGGRIRDIQAAGRGGHVIAGTAGYCFGNLFIQENLDDGHWELERMSAATFATPVHIAIDASNGASDYGNKFGEPIICGFTRSFGMIVCSSENREHREWVKPIMFSGGIGSIDDAMIKKEKPEKSDFVVKVGGPAYRIGIGGGAASSVTIQGDNPILRDQCAVQRGDPQMEQKMNRVIRSCLESTTNPIQTIHDQGAGGNGNVLKELVEGAGGVIFTKGFQLGDSSLSTLEIWASEYQESNAALVKPQNYDSLCALAKREKCPIDKVGFVTTEKKIRLIEGEFVDPVKEEDARNKCPVDLDLDLVLENMPRKVFNWTKAPCTLRPFTVGLYRLEDRLADVFKLPTVGSKRFLTNKVDRSVTGLIAQQQCVGPLHTPVADVAVVALSYFSVEGAATSIGEQPIKILLDPRAGARMSVLEALSNLASCYITEIEDIKCSANWMWPAKLPGEGWKMYEACEAMCDIMKLLNIAVDGGKDSLSMAARVNKTHLTNDTVIKSPGSLVISAYAPCPDVRKVVTPDFKAPSLQRISFLFLIKPSMHNWRIGGSALGQIMCQLGSVCPDLTEREVRKFKDAFNVIQKLIKDDSVLALHDISDGGLITCLVEMAISGCAGFRVRLERNKLGEIHKYEELPDHTAILHSEEIGWVMEVDCLKVDHVLRVFRDHGIEDEILLLGKTGEFGLCSIIDVTMDDHVIIHMKLHEMMHMWEITSFDLERKQARADLVVEEFRNQLNRNPKAISPNEPFFCRKLIKEWHGPYIPEVAVVREEGTNGDREMAAAFMQAGFIVHDVTMTDLTSGCVNLNLFRGLLFPGGFSYADVLGSGVGWGASIKENDKIFSALQSWKEDKNNFSLGVCNGCQLLANIGWIYEDEADAVRLITNASGRFESRWCRVRIEPSDSILFNDMFGATLGVWVAHGEGRFKYKNKVVEKAIFANQVVLRYVDPADVETESYSYNPNGSRGGVAGIVSPCGRHLAIMPHPERSYQMWQLPYVDFKPSQPSHDSLAAPWSKLFQNAYDFCIKNK